ncbi:MAG TPA: hypothetical protein VK530_18505 [Candidatus Acidoferrum sp.]|nr:hypothetical protein [Candidatus Acidoferrum sp.]
MIPFPLTICLAKPCCIAAILLALASTGRTAVSLEPPEHFFTNLSQRILLTMANDFAPVINVNAIMVWPTNHYGNGLHRVMQQAANIYDATRSNEFPSVFRPLFGSLGTTNCFIVGWTNDNSADGVVNWLAENTNAIPLVIAAKRGLPNFNEYTFRTDMLVERKLQLERPGPGQSPNKTNQMYVVGMSNTVAVEGWNSYATAFQRPSVIEVTNTVTLLMSNAGGIQALATHKLGNAMAIPSWSARTTSPGNGFKLPLFTNIIVLSNSVYSFANNQFESGVGTNIFEDGNAIPNPPGPFGLPSWALIISNHLVYIHRSDEAQPLIIDFVVLRDQSTFDLSSNLTTRALGPSVAGFSTVWNTIRNFGPTGPTEGIRAQIQFSQTGNTADWIPFSYNNGVSDVNLAKKDFTDWINRRGTNTNDVVVTPFNPIARFIRTATWQANDPLVHYHEDDLRVFRPVVTEPVKWNEINITTIGSSSISNINKPYAPWGNEGNNISSDPNALNFRLRDPGVRSSDQWTFPTNETLAPHWLGRVHRGTPWQTIYLKSGAATFAEWRIQANSSQNHPTNDWRMAAMFASLFNTNSISSLLSVNSTNRAAWRAAFTGMIVLTNILDDNEVFDPFSEALPFQSRFSTIQVAGTDPQLSTLLDGIESARATQGRGFFADVGALFTTPELSTDSPWLNLSPNQRAQGMVDDAYEILPSQLLALLRADPALSVVCTETGVTVEFTGCDECSYELLSSSDAQTWGHESGPHVTTNGFFRITLPVAESARFFRLQELH